MGDQQEKETLLAEHERNRIRERDTLPSSAPNINSTRISRSVHGETPSITSFVMIILFVFVALVSPATVLEITQNIRETKDQYISDYMKFGLTGLTIFVMLVIQILSRKGRRGLTETVNLSQSIPRWKVCLYLLMGIPAIISYVEMCTAAIDNKAEFCMNMSRLIFVFVQYVFFFVFSKLNCLKCEFRLPKPLSLHYVQMAIAIASNVAICIDLIIEDDREKSQNDWTAYVYPFRFEFMLFSISMWLEFFPKYESEVDSRSIGSEESLKHFDDIKCCSFWCINFIWSHGLFAFYVIKSFYNWFYQCNNFKITLSNNSNLSNATNTTFDHQRDKTGFTTLNIYLFLVVIFFEVYILIKICLNPTKKTFAMPLSLKPNELLLIVCALSFNVYQVAIIIPDIYFLANTSHDHWLYKFTIFEVVQSFLAIFYIFFQTALILKLARLEHNDIGFKMFSVVPIYYPALVVNMVIWLLSCFEKLNDCISWESSTAYKNYWHFLQNSLFPVGIFFQWHSGELLFEIGSELQFVRIYKQVWSYMVWRPISKCIQQIRNYRSDANTISP